MIDHALASTVQSLDILLLDSLLRNERNMRLARRCDDCFRVIAIVLLPPHKWLHVLRADNLHLVSQCLEPSGPVEGSGAGLDRDRAGWDYSHGADQLLAHDASLQHGTALAVCT